MFVGGKENHKRHTPDFVSCVSREVWREVERTALAGGSGGCFGGEEVCLDDGVCWSERAADRCAWREPRSLYAV